MNTMSLSKCAWIKIRTASQAFLVEILKETLFKGKHILWKAQAKSQVKIRTLQLSGFELCLIRKTIWNGPQTSHAFYVIISPILIFNSIYMHINL